MELIILLLREYPESYDIPSRYDPAPKSIPFIQHVKPYLDEEKEPKEYACLMQEMASVFQEAVACTKNPLMKSTSEIFDSWTMSRVYDLKDQIERISVQLQGVCDEFELQEMWEEEDFELQQ